MNLQIHMIVNKGDVQIQQLIKEFLNAVVNLVL